jgi:hypothetical protein
VGRGTVGNGCGTVGRRARRGGGQDAAGMRIRGDATIVDASASGKIFRGGRDVEVSTPIGPVRCAGLERQRPDMTNA